MSRSAVFAIRLSKPSTLPVSMKYRTVDGSATQPGDYTPKSGSITFRPGETMVQVVVPIRDTIPSSGPESFELEIYDKTNASIARAKAACVIPATAADSQPVITVGNISVSSQGVATFTLALSRAPVVAASINYRTTNGTAISGKDYTSATGTVSFAPGEVSKTVAIQTQAASDRDLVFYLDLLKPVKCTLYQNAPGAATILASPTVVNLVNAARYALDVYNAAIEALKVADARLATATTAYNDAVLALDKAKQAVIDAQNDITKARSDASAAQNLILAGAMFNVPSSIITGQAMLSDANARLAAATVRLNTENAHVVQGTADVAARNADVATATTTKTDAQAAADAAKTSLDSARAAATAAFVGSTTLVLA